MRKAAIALLLAGCSAGGGPAESTPTWRGATVDAEDRARAIELLDQGYRGWDPLGWKITFHDARFPCNAIPPTHDGYCRGLTRPGLKRIDTVYEASVVRWELGIARCGTLYGDWRDNGGKC